MYKRKLVAFRRLVDFEERVRLAKEVLLVQLVSAELKDHLILEGSQLFSHHQQPTARLTVSSNAFGAQL